MIIKNSSNLTALQIVHILTVVLVKEDYPNVFNGGSGIVYATGLAKLIGVTPTTVYNVLKGRTPITEAFAVKVLPYLNSEDAVEFLDKVKEYNRQLRG